MKLQQSRKFEFSLIGPHRISTLARHGSHLTDVFSLTRKASFLFSERHLKKSKTCWFFWLAQLYHKVFTVRAEWEKANLGEKEKRHHETWRGDRLRLLFRHPTVFESQQTVTQRKAVIDISTKFILSSNFKCLQPFTVNLMTFDV